MTIKKLFKVGDKVSLNIDLPKRNLFKGTEGTITSIMLIGSNQYYQVDISTYVIYETNNGEWVLTDG